MRKTPVILVLAVIACAPVLAMSPGPTTSRNADASKAATAAPTPSPTPSPSPSAVLELQNVAQLQKELIALQQELFDRQKQVEKNRQPAPEWVVWWAILVTLALLVVWWLLRLAEVRVREAQIAKDERVGLWKAFLKVAELEPAKADPNASPQQPADRLAAVSGQVSSLAARLSTVEREVIEAYEQLSSLKLTSDEIKEDIKRQRPPDPPPPDPSK